MTAHPRANNAGTARLTETARLTPAESRDRLSETLDGVVDLIQDAAAIAIAIPSMEAKLLLARQIEAAAGWGARIAARIGELDRAPVDLPARRRQAAARYPAPCDAAAATARLTARAMETGPALMARAGDHLDRLHPIWDEPTRRILDHLTHGIADQIADSRQCLTTIVPGPDETPAHAGGMPGRDRRFTVVDNARLVLDAPDHDGRMAELMHYTLMATEIPTIEVCCGMLRDFPDMPWDFVSDMGRQLWDEARHAEACIERLHEAGGRIGDLPVDHRNWRLSADHPLPVRLAVHQRIGEWLGVDAAIAWIDRLAGQGDVRTTTLLAFIAEDEIGHVAIGNRWLRRLCGDDDAAVWAVHRDADAIRQAAAGNINGHMPLPLNEARCLRGGFNHTEIAALRRQRS